MGGSSLDLGDGLGIGMTGLAGQMQRAIEMAMQVKLGTFIRGAPASLLGPTRADIPTFPVGAGVIPNRTFEPPFRSIPEMVIPPPFSGPKPGIVPPPAPRPAVVPKKVQPVAAAPEIVKRPTTWGDTSARVKGPVQFPKPGGPMGVAMIQESEAPVDLGNLLGKAIDVVGSVFRAEARGPTVAPVQPFFDYGSPPPYNPGGNVMAAQTGFGIPGVEVISESNLDKGLVYKKVCGEYKWVKQKRRRRRKMLTDADFNALLRIQALKVNANMTIAIAKAIGR